MWDLVKFILIYVQLNTSRIIFSKSLGRVSAIVEYKPEECLSIEQELGTSSDVAVKVLQVGFIFGQDG